MIFLCTVVISCLLAHVLEQTSRARFKAKQRVEETQVRGGQTPRGPWGWVPGEHGRKLLGTPEVRIPGSWKDLHDMLAEDDSNVYLVSKTVKENFFKSVETDEFI